MDQITPSIYVSTDYPAVTVGFISVPGGAIAVDAPTFPDDALEWRQTIEETTSGPILYTILTDAHPDRLFSAGVLGAPIVAARPAYEQATSYSEGLWRNILDGWARRYGLSGEELVAHKVALPEILFTRRVTFHRGEKNVVVECVAGAAPGSAWVYLEGENVLFAGDTVITDTHPWIAAAPNTAAWLETLRRLRSDRFSRFAIVTGRGKVCDSEATKSLSEYLVLARRRIRALLSTGRVRPDTSPLVAEMLSFFPVSDDEREWVQRRVKAGLDRLYEELRQNNQKAEE